jgi:hypothetical protein
MKFLRGGKIKMNKLFAFMIISLFMVGSFGSFVSADQGIANGDSIKDIEQIREVPGEAEHLEGPHSLSNERLTSGTPNKVGFWTRLRLGWNGVTSKFTGNTVMSQSKYLEGLGENEKLQIRKSYDESGKRLREYQQTYHGCLEENKEDCPISVKEVEAVGVGNPEQIVTNDFLIEDVREHILNHIMLVMDKLQSAKESIPPTTTDNSERIERIDSTLQDLDNFAVMIKDASTEQELKDIITKYKLWISAMKEDLLGYQEHVRSGRYGNFIDNAELIKEKTSRVIGDLDGLSTSDELSDIHNKFSGLINSAEENYEKSRLTDNAEESKTYLDSARGYLVQSREALRDLLAGFNERGITVEEIKNA